MDTPHGQDVMPMPGSKFSAFLDAVRRDAEDALHGNVARTPTSTSSPCTCLGGAVLQWKDGPEIVEVKTLVAVMAMAISYKL